MEKKEFEFFRGQCPKFEKGKKFFDPFFEYDKDETIFGKKEKWDENIISELKENYGYDKDEKIKWTRIFEDEIIPYNEDKERKLDLKQGILGDCCIISFIHCLKREMRDIILASVISDCKPIEGYFEVLFYFEENKNITRKKVFVDDFIPYKKIPKDYKELFNIPEEAIFMPIFSKLDNYMVGKYLLIEKAYAKVKGCYLDIEGTDIAFSLTGVQTEEKLLSNILMEKFLHKDEYILKDFYAQLKKEIEKNNLLLKDKKMETRILFYLQKKLIINGNYLDNSDKEEILNEIKKYSEKNLMRTGTENDKLVAPISNFGIWGNHMYDFIKCEKKNKMIFFYLWNPHGKNPDTNNNNYGKKYEDIDEINKKGLKNGDIILSFDRYFLSFRRIVYQNKEEVLKMNEKYYIDKIKYIRIIFQLFGLNFEFYLSLLWIKIFQNKGKDYKTIFMDLMNEIGSNKEINKIQFLWLLHIWNNIKENIFKESKRIMNEKISKNLNE